MEDLGFAREVLIVEDKLVVRASVCCASSRQVLTKPCFFLRGVLQVVNLRGKVLDEFRLGEMLRSHGSTRPQALRDDRHVSALYD